MFPLLRRLMAQVAAHLWSAMEERRGHSSHDHP
jgi:hypothetical protein